MDGFYKDALGFSEIWRGGQNDQTVDWINMKTPDGTEYIEYMLVGATPVTRSRLGSMHHVAIVVDDMQEAYEAVLARVPRDRVKEIGSPRVGRNRRWQLNLFDPDGTRTELMERMPMR
jgi:catechol 2,3-dioxygenase-like lactoylglutathione lyase family enzyme